jgi:hypothetical protein
MKAITKYASGLASTNLGSYLDRLYQLSSMGANAGAQTGNFGVSTGRGMADTTLAAGEAKASGSVGVGNAINGGIGSLSNNLSFYRMTPSSPSVLQAPPADSALAPVTNRMAQTIALLAQNPEDRPAGCHARCTALPRRRAGHAGQRSQEHAERRQGHDEMGQLGALAEYRKAAGAGDPNALGKLKAYPELQSKFHTALDTMKPDAQKEAINRGTEIATAAQRVAALRPIRRSARPPGTPSSTR